MMLKKALASVVAAGLLTGQAVVAVAATDAAMPNRTASPVGEAEELAGMSPALLVGLFAALAAGLIILIEEEEDDVDDLPVSP